MRKRAETTNLVAIFAISFGLISSFGGIDLASLGALFMLLSIYPFIKNLDLSARLAVNKLAIIAAIIAFVAYFVGSVFVFHYQFSKVAKSLITITLLIPFGMIAFNFTRQRRKVARAILGGFVLLLSILLIDALSNYSMYKMANPAQSPSDLEVNLGRGAFIGIAFFWVALLAIKEIGLSKKIEIMSIIAILFISTRFGMDLHIAIILIAFIASALSRVFPRLITAIVMLVPIILIAFAPLIYPFAANLAKNYMGENIPISWGRRADMWLYAKDKIFEKPIFGWGIDGARQFDERINYAGFEWSAIQMHPHASPLHIWFEGGLIGAMLAIIVVLTGAIYLLNSHLSNRNNAWALNGMLTSIIIGWCLSYSIWEQWLWALVFFLIGFISIIADKSPIINVKSNENRNYLSEL